MKEVFGIEANLIRGDGGIFDVVVDGDLIYSKKETGRFPDHAEIVQALQRRS